MRKKKSSSGDGQRADRKKLQREEARPDSQKDTAEQLRIKKLAAKEVKKEIRRLKKEARLHRKERPLTVFLNKTSVFWQALWCCVLYFLIETMSRHSFRAAWTYLTTSPIVFLYNAGILFCTFFIVYFFRSRVFIRTVLSFFWLVLGVINGVLLAKRVTPFTGPDFKNLTDGRAVMTKYMTEGEVMLLYIGIGILVAFLVIFLFASPRFRGKMHRIWAIVLTAASFAGLFAVTDLLLERRILSNYFGNIAFAYQDYGYPYCLFTTIFNTGISEPRDYSQEEITRIQRSENVLPKTQLSHDTPNIIFLQLESFMDPLEVGYLECSEDPIPIFRSLMKKYSSGYFKVPSIGAGTANTEFETITGMSLHYFGPGEYPYKSILKESTCESAAYVLANLGYSTHAIHNNEANFYARRTVFPMLGFDTYTSEEYMPEEDDKNPLGWVRDRVLTKEILKCLNYSEDPDYIYCVSVQGHGDYPDEPVLEDPLITVSGAPTIAMNNKWEYYVNQVHEMDEFVGELVAALSEYPEDVILVMYGDHLPTMGLTVEDLKNRYLFQTSYVIWDNFGLPKQNENLAAYQMAAEILNRLGIHEGTVMRFHQARRNTRNYQVDLELLQYDVLYGKKYSYKNGICPYEKTPMRLGLYDVTLDQVELISKANYAYYVRGTNFTPSSEIKLNGDWYDTVYINPTTLLISGTELTAFDRLAVVQRSNSSTRKALTKSFDRAFYAVSTDSPWRGTRGGDG